MKATETTVTHISADDKDALELIVEMERSKGDRELTVSSFIRRLIRKEIETRRKEYLLLQKVFHGND